MLNIPSAISSVCIKGKQLIKLAFLEDVNFSFCGTFEYVFPVMLWQCEKKRRHFKQWIYVHDEYFYLGSMCFVLIQLEHFAVC